MLAGSESTGSANCCAQPSHETRRENCRETKSIRDVAHFFGLPAMRKKKTSRQSLPAMFYCRLDTRCALPAILNRQSGGILQPLPSNFLLREGDMSRKPSEGVGTRTRAASASVVVDKRSRGHDAAPPSSGASHGTVGSKGATTDMARKRTRVSEVPPIKPLARHGEDVGEPERPPVRVGWVLLRGAVATAPRAASPCVHTGTGRCVPTPWAAWW